MTNLVLFVCTGNFYRSRFAEILFNSVAEKMGFKDVLPVTGQTYTRKIDSQIMDALSGLGQSAHKFGTDLRLLAHRQELEELCRRVRVAMGSGDRPKMEAASGELNDRLLNYAYLL